VEGGGAPLTSLFSKRETPWNPKEEDAENASKDPGKLVKRKG